MIQPVLREQHSRYVENARTWEPLLVCEDVNFAYRDGTAATRGISLSIGRGELFCLLGPNGAGKTTLVRLLSGSTAPSSGRILVQGRSVREASALAEVMGVIPQSAGLFEGLTVEQHLRAFGPLKGLSKQSVSAEVERVLEELQLQRLRKVRVGALSGGQQRAVLMALAMLGKPKILILDEPTVGLDPVARRALWDVLQREKARGTTMILTTHYLDEAEQLADRIAFIKAGQVVSCGTLAELYRDIGKSVRVTEYDPASGELKGQHYFDDLPDARAMINRHGLEAYALARVSLEDLYMRLFDTRAAVVTGESPS